MIFFFQVFLSLFILFPLSTAAPVDASTQTENAINNDGQSFESKLDAASLPEFRFLNLLAHPDHSILPEQNSFHNKTELILAIGQFATAYPSLPTVNALPGQFSEKWAIKGGEEGEINNLFGTINEMVKNAQIVEADGLRTTLLALYAIGGRILGDILDDKDALIGDDDEVFVFGLKKAFTKVERLLSGLDQNEQRIVTNAELLDNVAGIGNKLDEKYGKLENEEDLHIELRTILAGGQGGDKLIGQLVAQSINERMAEVADPNGGWGYVKKDEENEENDNEDDKENDEDEEKETPEEQNEAEEEEGEESRNDEQNGEENGEMNEEKKESETGNAEGNNPNDEGQKEEAIKTNTEANEDKKEGNNEEIKEPKEVEDEQTKQNNNEVEALDQTNAEKEEKKGMEGNNEVEEQKESETEEKKKNEEEEKNEVNTDEKVESEKAENEEEEEENKVKKKIEEKKEDAKDEAVEEKADEKEETPEVKENEVKEDEQELQMKKTLEEKKTEMPEKKKLTSNDIDAVEKEDV